MSLIPLPIFAQQVFDFNTTTNVYSFATPLKCPSTAPADLAICAGNNNQSLYGANSVWAECDLNPSPECATPGPPYDPSYVHVIRVTDANTFAAHRWDKVFHPDPSGGSNDNPWDATNTRFVLTASGNVQLVFSFDPDPSSPTYLQTKRLYPGKVINTTTAWFSRALPPYANGQTVSFFYALQYARNVAGLTGHANHPVIMSYDFTDPVHIPTIGNGKAKLIVDLVTTPHCLPADYKDIWNGMLTVSLDDQTFGSSLGQAQDSACYGVVWNRTLGCSVYDTCTATVTEFDGTTATVDLTDNNGTYSKWYIHDARMWKDGGKLNLSMTPNAITNGITTAVNDCISAVLGQPASSGTCGQPFGEYGWETGVPYPGNNNPPGNHVKWHGVPTLCGHKADGPSWEVNKCLTGKGGAMPFYATPWTKMLTGSIQLNPGFPTSSTCYNQNSSQVQKCPNDDVHMGWNNSIDAGDWAPFFGTTYATLATSPNSSVVPDFPTYYWDNEIIGVPTACAASGNCAGNPVWRVAHTYSNPEPTHSSGFYDFFAVGTLSSRPSYNQYFFIFTSNWYGQLGCQDGSYSASSMGLGCPFVNGFPAMRYDSFIVTIPFQ